MSDTNTGFTAARLAEQLKQAEREDLKGGPTYWWVPYIEDEDALDLLTYYKQIWDKETDFEETRLFKDMFRRQAGKSVREAMQNQNLSVQSAVGGFRDSGDDVSGVRQMLQVGERLAEEDAYIGYLYGDMGSGKTDFAVFLAELWERLTGGEVGTNIESLEQKDEHVDTFGSLEAWLEGSGEKLFVFDEASSHASGYAGDAGEVTSKFRGLLREFRKRDANLLIVGHTGKDVHPDIRRLATDCIHKPGKKRAVFYDVVEDGEGQSEKFEIEEIPATEWEFDTNEITEWSWSGSVEIEEDDGGESGAGKIEDRPGEAREPSLTEDDREEVRYLYETTEMTQKQLAELKDVSQATISKIV